MSATKICKNTFSKKAPRFVFYKTEEDLKYASDSDEEKLDLKSLPTPPVKIEDIQGTADLLKFITYIKEHELYKSNRVFKYMIKAEDPIKELDNMIGMKDPKRSIADQIISCSVNLAENNGKLDPETVMKTNTAIYGDPGCGKTTLGKIIAKIYFKLGITRNEKFVIAKASDLIAEYLGQTTMKTKKFLEKASGGFVFLDEAYQFAAGVGSSSNADSYGKKAIDYINQYITENPGDIIFGLGGYFEKTKKCFFAINEGLERRFGWHYHIKPYTADELCDMFHLKASDKNIQIVATKLNNEKKEPESNKKRKRGLRVPAISPGAEFFKEHLDKFPYSGGDVETMLYKCMIINEKRTIMCPEEKGKITDVDLEKGFTMYLESIVDRKPKVSEMSEAARSMFN